MYKNYKIQIAYLKLQTFLAAIFFSISLHGQPKPLQIGDTLSGQLLTTLTSNQKPTTGNRLILLDFWATWCGSCYKRFPHLDSLQQEFTNSVTIILVNTVSTHDNSDKINSFFAKRKNINGASFQFQNIIGDSVLNNLFPHILLPHYVWIYNNQYLAATGPDEVSAINIKAVLNNTSVSWKIKDDSLQFEKRKRLMNK